MATAVAVPEGASSGVLVEKAMADRLALMLKAKEAVRAAIRAQEAGMMQPAGCVAWWWEGGLGWEVRAAEVVEKEAAWELGRAAAESSVGAAGRTGRVMLAMVRRVAGEATVRVVEV